MQFPVSLQGLEALLNAVPDSLFLLDPDTSNILYCNRAAHQELGYAAEELVGHSVLSLQKDVTGLPQWGQIAEVIRQSSPYVFVGRHRHRDGHEISVEVVTNTFEFDGQPYFLSSARNIGNRTLLDKDILSREAHLLFALNEASDGMWDWHLPSGNVYFSPQLKRMLGYGPHELSPTVESWTANVHPEDQTRVFQVLDQHLRGERERYEAQYRLKNRNGHYLWVNDRGRVCERDPQLAPTRVVGMVHNITDQKMLEMELMLQASHDSLTGLRNRREAEQALLAQLSTCQRLGVALGVCLFDLDHFKQINDVHGHLVGDQVLVRVARHLSQALRGSDALFRWGGEEFLLLVPGLGVGDMLKLGQKLCAEFAALPMDGLPGVEPVTASFGMAVMPEHGQTSAELLLAADTALYSAKAAGRHCVRMAQPLPPPALTTVA